MRKIWKAIGGAVSAAGSAFLAWAAGTGSWADFETAFVALGGAVAGFIITYFMPKNEEV